MDNTFPETNAILSLKQLELEKQDHIDVYIQEEPIVI